MKVIDWMGRDILVPCDAEAVWKRVAEETNNREVIGWSFDAWTKVLSVSCDSGRGGIIHRLYWLRYVQG